MSIVIQTKWECQNCYDLHDSEDEAIECCPPEVQEVFICPKCGETNRTEDEAIECCKTDPAEVMGDDGKKFPSLGAHMSTAEYLAAYYEINKVIP